MVSKKKHPILGSSNSILEQASHLTTYLSGIIYEPDYEIINTTSKKYVGRYTEY
jgi:hypothetical protein